jgi:hypothetical protein
LFVPSKNSTLLTPSPSVAATCTEILAGAVKLAPSAGLVMLTEGGVFSTMLTFTTAEVLAAPRLSVATAVSA